MKPVRVFADSEAMAEEIARRWHHGAKMATKSKGVYSVVLSGGTTASKVYHKLASPLWINKIPWDTVHIFWADERCVSPEHEESNYLNIQRTFLNDIQIPGENVHRIRGEEEPSGESCRYEKEIIDHLMLRKDEEKLFDWVLLGLGSDGHTASLFSGQESLLDTQDLCAVVQHPVTGQKRITLTPYALNRSGSVTYHVIGSGKAAMVAELISEDSDDKRFFAGYIEGEWFLDTAAASKVNFSRH